MQKTDEQLLTNRELKWSGVPIDSKYFDDDLYKIIRFYVINSPCNNYCTQGYNLSYYGWKEKPWYSDRYLKCYLDEGVFEDNSNFQTAKNLEEMTLKLRKANLLSKDFYKDTAVERVAVVNVENNKYMSLFYHIRCALAHGRFIILEDGDNIIYIMENGVPSGKNFKIKARMILSKQTLLKWIDIISNGPIIDENEYMKECMVKVIDIIHSDKHSTKKQMKKILNESDGFTNKIVEILKKAKLIEYKGRGGSGYWIVDEYKKDKFFENYTGTKVNELHSK